MRPQIEELWRGVDLEGSGYGCGSALAGRSGVSGFSGFSIPAHKPSMTAFPLERQRFIREVERSLAESNGAAALLSVAIGGLRGLAARLGEDLVAKLASEVATRVSGCVRAGDLIAHGYDDEILVAVFGVGVERVEEIADRIHGKISTPLALDGGEFLPAVRIGVARTPEHGSTVRELISCARQAAGAAPPGADGGVCHFSPGLQLRAERESMLECRLRAALAAHALHLVYQPKFRRDGRLIGAEALARWNDPDLGVISPAEFIPIAESHGLIGLLGEQVLEMALPQLVVFQRELGADFVLSVNVSPLQFAQRDFRARLERILLDSGANPAGLELELTESVFLQDGDGEVSRLLHQLKHELGLRLAIDDFGAGYSSIGYLHRLPIDTLKLDRSLVTDLPHGRRACVIVRAVQGMADALGLLVVAEGVETREQADYLALNCKCAFQGFYFSHPLEACALTRQSAINAASRGRGLAQWLSRLVHREARRSGEQTAPH